MNVGHNILPGPTSDSGVDRLEISGIDSLELFALAKQPQQNQGEDPLLEMHQWLDTFARNFAQHIGGRVSTGD